MSKLLITLLVLTSTALADSKVFIFRPNDATTKHIGTVNVSPAILIRYGLELSGSRPRFIALDSKTTKLNPRLEVGKGNSTGFLIVTSEQPVIDVVISSGLMSKVRTAVDQNANQVMAREANLGVEFTKTKGKLRITRVILD